MDFRDDSIPANTALHVSVYLGLVEVVRVLLQAGADPDKAGEMGISARDQVKRGLQKDVRDECVQQISDLLCRAPL